MSEPLEETYFRWLCTKVARVEVPTPSLTYYNLFRLLHNTEFVWLLPGDDNRAEDGVDLRHEFLTAAFLPHDSEWMEIGCSVFEMLVAFSRRCAFDTEQTDSYWFWIFLENLDLAKYNDADDSDLIEVPDILYRLVWRTYDSDGNGGICPLENPEHDQRKVELWYQFCEYLVDHQF